MLEPLLVTEAILTILQHILVPGQRVLRQLSEKFQAGHLRAPVFSTAGYGKTTTLLR